MLSNLVWFKESYRCNMSKIQNKHDELQPIKTVGLNIVCRESSFTVKVKNSIPLGLPFKEFEVE